MPSKMPIINARISGSGGSSSPETEVLYRKRLICLKSVLNDLLGSAVALALTREFGSRSRRR